MTEADKLRMTEAGWLGSDDPLAMLQFVRTSYRVSDRKQRLLSVACCRQMWNLFTDERSRQAVEVAEQFADGIASKEGLVEAQRAARHACDEIFGLANNVDEYAIAAAAAVFAAASSSDAAVHVVAAACQVGTFGDISKEEPSRARRSFLTGLTRDFFGNPFPPISFSPEWRTITTVALARLMYDSRDFGAMPILADALQDAGCDNE